MIRLALLALFVAAPAIAEELPKSEAATAFMQRCLTDVSDHRIATLTRQAPDYAASLSDEDLLAGGMFKAQRACPCFLHIIAIDPDADASDPEEKVERLVSYMCGERASTLPPLWVVQ